ncbi:MAG TPA: hypothetical protein VFL99_05320 [Segeticoccus sp.]|uniref:hypothetical protein n=1 Tax=Segeticoccus sp. TaxID=2706531 RepID=UPI002D7E48F3|nr:hypothetical protein [Segeticoccus sp.]HET8599727.1 hypothetical protein [Segeticoccus sp.]
MRTKKKMLMAAVPVAGCLAALGATAPAAHAAGTDGSGGTSYQATLAPVALNTPSGAASGHVTITINGDRATVSEQVSGLATTLPTDTKTLSALGIPAAFAGKPFPHVQHIHINGQGVCPTSSADANGDGVISTVEGHHAYGMIGTTLSTKGSTGADTATDVTVAPGGGSFTYQRTFTLNQDTLSAIKNNKAVVVVHGLNPANAPKASLSTPNSLGVTLPGANKKLALIGTAPAVCGKLVSSQMNTMPSGGVATGGGSTSGVQDQGLFYGAGGLLLGAGAVLALRRRFGKQH